jgi:hypothetical protein
MPCSICNRRLQGWRSSGALQTAIEQSFDADRQAGVSDAVDRFLANESRPDIAWWKAPDPSIRGAYLAEADTILLNQALETDSTELHAVLLEEFGHWLDDQAGNGDSVGDEGERFSARLRGESVQPTADHGDQGLVLWKDSAWASEFAELLSTYYIVSPNDVVLSPDGQIAYITDSHGLLILDVSTTLYGTSGNDELTGFSGYYAIDGGVGVDRINYSLPYNNASFSLNADAQLVVQGSAEQSEILTSVERVQFTDTAYALDIDGNAGIAAKVIITTFGAGSIGDYMSVSLSLVDGGTTLEELCDLVVNLNLIDQLTGSSSNGSFVGHVFENVIGRAPNLIESPLSTGYLDDGTYTKSSLLALAANTTLTANLVTASSVDLIGVPGSADGEMLAIQYDPGLA